MLAITGSLTNGATGLGGVPLALQANAYPFRGFLTIAHALTAADGSFAFVGVRLDRNTRVRVTAESLANATSSVAEVIVNPSAEIHAHSVGPGRARLSIRLRHPSLGSSPPAIARWFVAARHSRSFHLAAVTLTRELSPGLTYASAVVDPPSRRFVYRVCVNPSWERAMGSAASHHRCPAQDFRVPQRVE